jgi:inner membrane protein
VAKVAVVGSTGYTGAELVSLFYQHPGFELAHLTSETFQGQPFSSVYPRYQGRIDQPCEALEQARLPDYDLQIPFVSHRGPTHTVWFALAVGVVVGFVGAIVAWSQGVVAALGLGIFGLFVGMLTVAAHILADVLTPTGVRPFAPVRETKYTLDVVTAANTVANYGLLAIGGVLAVGAFAAGTALN